MDLAGLIGCCCINRILFEMIPKSYKDLTKNQLLRILPIIVQLHAHKDNFQYIIGCLKKIVVILRLGNVEMFWALKKLQWLWTTKIDFKPFESFRIGWTSYFLPEPNFENTSGIELAMANIYYLKFATTQDIGAFNELLAIFCRPRKWNWWWLRLIGKYSGDDRIAYYSMKTAKVAKIFRKKLPVGYSFAILQYFESMNKQFMGFYKEVFEKDESTKQLFANGEGWIATLEDVAKDGVHGEFDKVCEQNAHTIWMYLKHNKIKTDEQIRQLERNKD